MATKIEMPKLSDTMEEGVLHAWNVQEGDQVKSGDVIAEVETDKATMEVEVFDAGTILKIVVDEGASVPLGGTIAVIGEEGEDIESLLSDNGGEEKDEPKADQPDDAEAEEAGSDEEEDSSSEQEESTPETSTTQQVSTQSDGRILASPLAKKMAKEQDIDLSTVTGSGPNGRIIKKDIENYEPSAAEGVSTREDKEIPVSQMRKTIAKRLAESKYSNPHYYETIDIDAGGLFEARKNLNDAIDDKVSFNDIIVKACSMALKKHPQVNSSWQGDKIIEYGHVSVAFAVAIEEGLVTPVIRNSDQKGLLEISDESKDMAKKARNRDLDMEQMEGSTFTISNLGMFGIDEFTAIINPPNACILAVGGIREVPVVKEGEVVPGKRMKVTLSSDHRIVDGATAAQFLNTLRTMLENPLGMLL